MLKKVGFKLFFPVVLVSILGFQAITKPVYARDVSIQAAINLQKDGTLAQEKGIPVLLEFSMQGCSFCEIVEEEVLRPMLLNRSYDSKVMIRKVMIDEDTTITDFNGKPVTYEELASRYNIMVTPTLVLLHGNGDMMGLEMVGVSTIDFYPAYLDQAIEQALQKISTAAESVKISAGLPAS
ncbi:MAG: thioredoxin fold domain-containing protein [Gammaproteobacteria bacterium]|nr:thioredoxin fold domain-containing protein [Gammaproteobacteria bacterium]